MCTYNHKAKTVSQPDVVRNEPNMSAQEKSNHKEVYNHTFNPVSAIQSTLVRDKL